MEKIQIKIEGVSSQNDKNSIEAEIEVLNGVKSINVDEKSGASRIEFDNSLISFENITNIIEKLGYRVGESAEINTIPQEYLYFVKGMHCASCEILIEKRLLAIKGVKSVDAKAGKGEVLIEYVGKKPKLETLNSIFRKDNYSFFDKPFDAGAGVKGSGFFTNIVIALVMISGFLYLNKLGFSGFVSVDSKSSLFAFFGLGLIAGISSCAALVGGLVLSMSKQWLEIYSYKNISTFQKLQPHLMFNIGRVLTYAVLGGLLGAVGSKLQISLQFSSFLIIAVSIIMLILAFQMLGVKALRRFQPTLPKFATRYIADETNFKGRYMPFIMGGLTFFLPCGFTITSQGLALLSGNPVQGGLIMALFALGTAPALLLIGFSAVKFSSQPRFAYQFSRVAALIILFFALFNINNQMNVLGFVSLNDIKIQPSQANTGVDESSLAPIVNGKQSLKMEASSSGYRPNYFKVKVNTPVRWEITDVGTSGCTNAVISNSLFSGNIPLTPGQTSVKEFTPTKAGKYKFSCWMGMVSGIIEVIDPSSQARNSVAAAAIDNDEVIPSGAKGCGCGGGGISGCSLR